MLITIVLIYTPDLAKLYAISGDACAIHDPILRITFSKENKLYLLILLAAALIILGLTCCLSKLAQTRVPNRDGQLPIFEFEPLTKTKIAKAAESYRNQERTIELGEKGLDNLEKIQTKNSDPLPNRTFVGFTGTEMCESGRAQCVQAFAKIRPLIVTAPNHHLMSCIVQKSMSTVMSAIFCFLIREKEFVDAGRSILREYADIRLCEGKNEFKSVKDMEERLYLRRNDLNNWRFTMVTREPVDRFLSGFIDRCIRRCDMDAFYDRYQFIRYSNDPSDTLLDDLTPLLRSQNTSPNHHLMSCLINKSMSTVMSAIFCFLVREKEFMEAGRSILMEYPDIRFCEGKNEFRSVKDMQKGLRLTDHQLDKYHFSMVTREPVDRFLSGFIDRCIRVGDPCFGCGSNITCFLEEEYRRRCDMREFYNRYQFIRYSSDPTKTLLEDLTPMLRSQNVSESSINYISESLRSGRTAHSTVKSAARVFFEDRIRHSPYLMELITAPNHNLMSCLIQKSMSTVMSAIFCYLLREKEFIAAGRSILREYPDIRFCEGKNEFKSVMAMERGLQSDGPQFDKWKFTMVTREPVDRFLSGFIDRCIRVGDSCFGCGINMTCFLEEELKRAAKYAYGDSHGFWKPKITMEDIHVFPQNWRCDMGTFYDRYHFIRYSNDPSETLLEDLTPILRSQNVSESSINYISESLRSGRTAHSTVKSAARVFLENRIRHSPYLMELIVRLFYYDYTLLNYPLPDLDALAEQKAFQIFAFAEYRRRTADSAVFKESTLSKRQIASVGKRNVEQETTTQKGLILDDLETIKLNNADLLPPRMFENLTADQLCQSASTGCLSPFIRTTTLLSTAPNYRLATCLVHKNMSTLMLNIICYLLRGQVFIDMGRSLLKDNWDTSRCNLDKYYDNYKFIQYSSNPNTKLLQDLVRVLAEQKVPQSSIDYITNVLQSGRTGHTTFTSKARAFLEHRLRSSPYLMELLVRTFYYDFKLFGYPLPGLESMGPNFFQGRTSASQ
ncbi:unnamed protein product [Haemonchus placei]|uniref:Site-specific DNA-methyltransferase (adenine-specific) n=1 Tax=Haemonchus placei TaxID=6290 RepID=A0A158QN75_HAEPC|nr:unnamed protein product [Haemonchus placei]